MTVPSKVLAAIPVFILPRVAERMAQLARSSSTKSQAKLRGSLAHFDAFDPSCVRRPASDDEFERLIRDAQHRLGGQFELLSESPQLDGRSMSSDELLNELAGSWFGTFAVLDPEHFAVYAGEETNSRIVLVR